MWTLLRLLFWSFVLAVMVWFSVMIPLGKHTLWGHLRAIGGTREAKELADGTKAEAKRVADRLFEHSDGGTPDLGGHAGKPLDDPNDQDRRALDKLTKKKP